LYDGLLGYDDFGQLEDIENATGKTEFAFLTPLHSSISFYFDKYIILHVHCPRR